MAGSDLRVALTPLLAAFSVAATVTRPQPNDTPITTEGIWLPEQTVDRPGGSEFTRASRERVFCLDRSIGRLPTGTVIEAAEESGGTVRRWIVDGVDREEHDLIRVLVVNDDRP